MANGRQPFWDSGNALLQKWLGGEGREGSEGLSDRRAMRLPRWQGDYLLRGGTVGETA